MVSMHSTCDWKIYMDEKLMDEKLMDEKLIDENPTT
jgi:hypothetical protein